MWNLRSQRGFACVKHALAFEAQRGELRVVHYSVQGNHLHLVVEAADKITLSRRMQGFGIRLARRLNAMMGRRGRVYGDRYHARVLGTPRTVWRAIRYVLENHRHHVGGRTAPRDPWASGALADLVAEPERPPGGPASDLAPGADDRLRPIVAEPVTWLLADGWRRGRSADQRAEV